MKPDYDYYYDYCYDYCYECSGYGDDYYLNDDGELVAVKTERDIFKGLYTNLLERVMKGA